MVTKTKTTDRPLSVQIDEHQAEADRLAGEVRTARERAAALEQERVDRELLARRTWSEGQVGRLREIFRVADAARGAAVAAFKAGQDDAHALWVRWRTVASDAGGEWGVISSVFEASHPGERAPKGRSFIGGGPGTTGERWEEFAHRLAIEMSTEAAAAARKRTLAQLAELVGSTDLAALEESVTPVARFFRGRMEVNAHGTPIGDVKPWPGTVSSYPWSVTFDATGHLTVYDSALADLLDANPNCARVRTTEGEE